MTIAVNCADPGAVADNLHTPDRRPTSRTGARLTRHRLGVTAR
jgi:hypothetical protein